ncbi:MAG: hypothetical protein LKG23_05205 [Nitrospira sp.]|nr:hypothetical protein [Nitrospira sp.]
MARMLRIPVLTSSQRTAVPNLSAGQGTVATPAPLSTSTTNQAAFTDAKNKARHIVTDALNRVTTITWPQPAACPR